MGRSTHGTGRLDNRHHPAPSKTHARGRRALSVRAARVALQFGLPLDSPPPRRIQLPNFPLARGQTILITGPSGAGKTTLLREIEMKHSARNVARVELPAQGALLDAIEPAEPMTEALSVLTTCGLGEAPLWLRPCDELSEGERFRARLARAISLHAGSAAPLIIDEFCSGLHRRCAQAIAFNLRKLATRRGLCIVAATASDDLTNDLQPDIWIRLDQRGEAHAQSTLPRSAQVSFREQLVIEPGGRAEYEALASMHYRGGDEPGFVDKVFTLRAEPDSELLGVVVYAHGPIELALRNQATGGIFVRNPARLNREMRILRRLVIHPDVRGCGLGHELVRRTLPRVGTPYVECLAAMGAVNPVFEKAGMQRIGVCPAPRGAAAALEQLRRLRIDPAVSTFTDAIARSRAVRQIVGAAVQAWYRATTGTGAARAARQSPQLLARIFRNLAGSQPVYYLWHKERSTNRQSEIDNRQ